MWYDRSIWIPSWNQKRIKGLSNLAFWQTWTIITFNLVKTTEKYHKKFCILKHLLAAKIKLKVGNKYRDKR